MSLFFEYGRHVAALPKLSGSLLARAGKTELQLLLALSSDESLMADYESNADALAATLKVKRSALDSALGFWIGAGVLGREDGDVPVESATRTESTVPPQPAAEPPISVPKRTVTTELPRYTADELDTVMAHRKNASHLVDEAQKALGKIFTSHSEVSQLMGIAEGLGLSDEYILILLAHCREKGKSSLRYAEKLAVSLYDRDITTAEALSEHLHALELAESVEGHIRRLFGIGTRSFTAKEKGFIADWVVKYGFGVEMLEKAYEFAVDATTNPNLSYVNSILVRWHEEKISTPEEADRDHETHRAAAEPPKKSSGKSQKKAPQPEPSFDVDEFFAAAIRKGYEGNRKD